MHFYLRFVVSFQSQVLRAGRLSDRPDEPQVNKYEIDESERRQDQLEAQDSWVVLDRHEVSVLNYIGEHQNLEKYRATETTQAQAVDEHSHTLAEFCVGGHRHRKYQGT